MERSISTSGKSIDWRDGKNWVLHRTPVMWASQQLVRLYYAPQIKINKYGFENIPSGGFILAVNHISNDDAPILGIALPRYPFYMAKIELFEKFGWVYKNLGAFPIHRNQADPWAVAHVGKLLAAGQMCAMFVEGSRNGKGKVQLRPGKTGAVRLAHQFNAPVVPCAILGPEKLYTRRWKGWRPVTVSISVGKPIDVRALAPEAKPDKETYHRLTDAVMREIAALMPEENRGYYA